MLNSAAFAQWSGRDLSAQDAEVFACRHCGSIVVGLPDEHSVYFDPANPRRTSFYNGVGSFRCPLCQSDWYRGGAEKYQVRSVTREEFCTSPWAWLAYGET